MTEDDYKDDDKEDLIPDAISTESLSFSSILASSVHDMKNSLSLLINHLELVIEKYEKIDNADYNLLSHLQYEAKRVNNNLIQLLAIYRLENTLYSLNIAHNSLMELMEDIESQNKQLFEYKNITLEIESCDDIYWFFDYEMIAGALNSVLNNSFRYSKSKVAVSYKENDGYMTICVEDNGDGYPPFMLTDPDPGKNKISFRTGSTGLGLYFSQVVARLHKNKGKEGFISIKNGGKYGGGCYCINLP